MSNGYSRNNFLKSVSIRVPFYNSLFVHHFTILFADTHVATFTYVMTVGRPCTAVQPEGQLWIEVSSFEIESLLESEVVVCEFDSVKDERAMY